MIDSGLRIARRLALFISAAIILTMGLSASAHAASVTTEWPDYAPGDTVVIIGSGWLPGETVILTISEDGGHCGDHVLSAVADENGDIYNDEFVVQDGHIGMTFTLTGFGETSGLTAEASFTDACPAQHVKDPTCTPAGAGACAVGCRQLVGLQQCNATATAPLDAGTSCRASAGICDVAELCNGTSETCPSDTFVTAGTVCRAATGDCDVAESCTGSSASCPADGKQPDDTPCDDDDICNVGETCQSGVCTGGSEPDCSAESDQCNTASCDPDGVMDGNCDDVNPVADDTPCDDEDACNVDETCQSGECTGGDEPDCSTAGDQCNTASCDPTGSEGNCDDLTPVADDTSCNDGDACNVGESCQSGECTGGDDPDCSTAGDQCNTASCASTGSEGNCDALTPVVDDTSCDDGDACNVGESCQSGECIGGDEPDCSAAGDQCNTASCDPTGDEGNCETLTPVTDDTPCDDESVCTETDTCQSGECVGADEINCDDSLSCTTDTCDAEDGCEWEPVDSACDDDNVCTADTCDAEADASETTTGCVYALDPTSGCEASVTDSKLCPFDVDPDSDPDSQFRLIFTPDQNLLTSSKLSASNPGQFYYNAMYVGPGEETVEIDIPYPFVTQGGNPVHVYDSVTPEDDGCFTPGDEIASAKILVVLDDYDPQEMGSTATVGVELPALAANFAYINIHLDYGLKKTAGYAKNSQNDAVDVDTLDPIIPDETDYEFSDTTGGSDTAQSLNVFKRTPGFAGLVNDNLLAPVPGVKVEIHSATGALLKTVYTDDDGWYFWQYKHKGKAATYKVVLPDVVPPQEKSATMQANQLVVVNFALP